MDKVYYIRQQEGTSIYQRQNYICVAPLSKATIYQRNMESDLVQW